MTFVANEFTAPGFRIEYGTTELRSDGTEEVFPADSSQTARERIRLREAMHSDYVPRIVQRTITTSDWTEVN